MNQLTKASPVTIFLVVASILIFSLTYLAESEGLLRALLIADPESNGLNDIARGQAWRLVTPMFLHFGIMHIVFNMMCTWDLGRLIEARRGSIYYAALVLVLSAVSNFAQYRLTGSPFFGGMSGVVYGLFGYVWGQGLGRSDLGFRLNRNTVVIMLAWYVLCWTGIFGQIANWAHTAGLVAGTAWGYLAASIRKK